MKTKEEVISQIKAVFGDPIFVTNLLSSSKDSDRSNALNSLCRAFGEKEAKEMVKPFWHTEEKDTEETNESVDLEKEKKKLIRKFKEFLEDDKNFYESLSASSDPYVRTNFKTKKALITAFNKFIKATD